MTQSAYITEIFGKNRLMVGLLYGSGLGLMELAGMRIKEKDIDFDANTVNVRSGKGDKDAQLFFRRHPSLTEGCRNRMTIMHLLR